jgi:hypothetical protein
MFKIKKKFVYYFPLAWNIIPVLRSWIHKAPHSFGGDGAIARCCFGSDGSGYKHDVQPIDRFIKMSQTAIVSYLYHSNY